MARTSAIAKEAKKKKFPVRYHSRCKRCGRPRGFLRKFQLHEALRLIGSLSYQWFFTQKQSVGEVRGVPVSDSLLAYLAMRLIESSNDYRSVNMAEADILRAADMYWGLPDPLEVEE